MAEEARKHGALAIVAVGTAGLRIAANRDDVVAAIEQRTGVHIEVISGEDEARLAYLAAKSSLDLAAGSLVVFDTGGGSSQFTFGRGNDVEERFSVDVGAVRYTERFGLDGVVSAEVLRDALAAISADLSRLDGRPSPDGLVAMGGATTNITAVKHGLAKYDPNVVQGTVLDRKEIDRQIDLYRSMDAAARRGIVGLQPKRAEVILAGACIIRIVMEKLGKRLAHRQRPWPAPRRACGALWKLKGATQWPRRRQRRRESTKTAMKPAKQTATQAGKVRVQPDSQRPRSFPATRSARS